MVKKRKVGGARNKPTISGCDNHYTTETAHEKQYAHKPGSHVYSRTSIREMPLSLQYWWIPCPHSYGTAIYTQYSFLSKFPI